MKNNLIPTVSAISLLVLFACNSNKETVAQKNYLNESPAEKEQRMAWWRDARFGMFIHWGLYSIPAGEWNGQTDHAEWIRTTAEIPLETYNQFLPQFNPVSFDAAAWVRMAKDAGMMYIVITSKHHDGFCLFDSKETDFDVMSSPFKRDILKELADACEKEGIRLCFYHSIMDWHHPDYLPRRTWEKDRPTEGADYQRFTQYLKNQLRELCSNYGKAPHVLWFDGEWEDTWTHEQGLDLYNYVRNLRPEIIINNRVDTGRNGMAGFSEEGFAGDFGTPEQEIPATGLPGVDWESCMTMNDHWGYNKADKNFKSTEDLLQKLADIASKGGNFLLNIGPKADGTFPQESIDRLREIGDWMKLNSDAIYGTSPSPFDAFDWGRCTWKMVGENTHLYLHVFDAPKDGKLVLNGVANEPAGAQFLAYPKSNLLPVERKEDALIVSVPQDLPDTVNSVVVLVLKGRPDIHRPPVILAKHDIFIEKADLKIPEETGKAEIRYTLDGSEPTIQSNLYTGPVSINKTTTLAVRYFRDGKPLSGSRKRTLEKVEPQQASTFTGFVPGLQYRYFEGDWDKLPEFDKLKTVKTGTVTTFDRSAKNESGERYGFDYQGFVKIPADGIYTFSTESDDGSALYLDGKLLVSNDGLHGMTEVTGVIALREGYHKLNIRYFNKTGGAGLKVYWEGETSQKEEIPPTALFHLPAK